MLKAIAMDLTFGDNQEPFKLNMPDIQNDINVMVGQNGTGKTMMLTCVWFAGFLLQTYQASLMAFPHKADTLFGETANDVAAMTFNHSEEMSGMFVFKGSDRDGRVPFEFILQYEKGKLVNFNIEVENPSDYVKIPLTPVLFNSKDARQFTSYERYLEILKMADIDRPRSIDDFKKVAKIHKLYDIMWFEHVRGKLEDWKENGFSDKARSTITDFHKNWPSDHDAFGPEPKMVIKGDIPWIESQTINKKLSEFGAGHQSVLMTTMFL